MFPQCCPRILPHPITPTTRARRGRDSSTGKRRRGCAIKSRNHFLLRTRLQLLSTCESCTSFLCNCILHRRLIFHPPVINNSLKSALLWSLKAALLKSLKDRFRYNMPVQLRLLCIISYAHFVVKNMSIYFSRLLAHPPFRTILPAKKGGRTVSK